MSAADGGPIAPPAITAVVPTHKRPEPLRRAVQSVVDQSYGGEIEILVVFDACEPALPAVHLPGNRTLRALVNARTPGPAGARNTGVLAASHPLIAFLDDDDTWMPDKLDEQMALLGRRPEAVFVGAGMLVDDGRRRHERLVGGDAVTHRDLLHSRVAALHTSTFVIRRSALVGELGLFDEGLPRSYCEDYDLLLRAAKQAPIAVVDRPLVHVLWNGESYFYGQWTAYADAWRSLLDRHPEFHTSRRAIGRIEAQVAFSLAASGARSEGAAWAWRSLRHDVRQVRSWLAVAIALRLTSAARVARVVGWFGREI